MRGAESADECTEDNDNDERLADIACSSINVHMGGVGIC